MHLVDYKVRSIDPGAGADATVRVLVESTDGLHVWRTVGASTDVIEASWLALQDSYEYVGRPGGARGTGAGVVGLDRVGSPLSLIEPLVSWAVLSCLLCVLFLNRELFRFFFRERGMRFAMATFLIHLLYFLYSGTVFSSYWASHTLVRRSVSFLRWL